MAKVALNVRIDPVLMEALKKQASAENRTLSNLVDTVLRGYVFFEAGSRVGNK